MRASHVGVRRLQCTPVPWRKSDGPKRQVVCRSEAVIGDHLAAGLAEVLEGLVAADHLFEFVDRSKFVVARIASWPARSP